MVLELIVPSIIEFIKLFLLVFIPSFILYKIFSPIRVKLAERLNFSWVKSSLLLNFIVMLVLVFVVYILFMYLGQVSAVPRDPDLDYDFLDNVLLILASSGRIIVSAILLSFVLLFFEMIASFSMGIGEHRRGKKQRNELLTQAVGIGIMSIIFLLLLLFVFDWVPLGLFVYIFYGSLNPLPLMVLLGI
jgi:hypothetical protein